MSTSKKIAVLGLGKTGISCVRYLASQGHEIVVLDQKENPSALANLKKEFPSIPFFSGDFSENLLNNVDEIVLSPGVPLAMPMLQKQIKRGTPVYGDIELFAKANQTPVIAITGSNGKSTVTTLMGKIIEACGLKVIVAGNIGTPVLDFLHGPQPDYYVLELSSFQLETIQNLKAAVATVINVCPDHLDRYPHYEAYVKAKRWIYHGCDIAIVNQDQPEIWQSLPLNKKIYFSMVQAADFCLLTENKQIYLANKQKKLIAVDEFQLIGKHYWQNALVALAIGNAIQLPMDIMLKEIASFTGLRHRCQWIRQYQGVDWYNDSKATNIGAACSSIDSLGAQNKGQLILIAGGLFKEKEYALLQASVKHYVAHTILIGRDAPLLAEALTGLTDIIHAKDLADAILKAKNIAKPKDTVLLAPACASYDMFNNFEHRGDLFMDAVNALI